MSQRPTRGEIWWVNLDPTIGSEIRKKRPAVVVSSALVDHLNVRVIVPLTSWQDRFQSQINKVRVPRSQENGLVRDSAADVSQVRSVSLKRFSERLGHIESELIDEIVAGVVVVLGHFPLDSEEP